MIDEKTASVNARAIFPNQERQIIPGEFVRIILQGIMKRKVSLIPQKAVMQTTSGSMVYVVQDGRAVLKNIKIGDTAGGKVPGNNFVIEEGLNQGDLVILDNIMKIRPGAPVKIEGVINEEKR